MLAMLRRSSCRLHRSRSTCTVPFSKVAFITEIEQLVLVRHPGYISNGMPEKVIELFQNVSVEPDAVMLLLFFNACAKHVNERSILLGTEAIRRLPPQFSYHENLNNAAIDMLLKFGQIRDAERVFQSAKKKSADTYTTMMQGCIISAYN